MRGGNAFSAAPFIETRDDAFAISVSMIYSNVAAVSVDGVRASEAYSGLTFPVVNLTVHLSKDTDLLPSYAYSWIRNLRVAGGGYPNMHSNSVSLGIRHAFALSGRFASDYYR